MDNMHPAIGQLVRNGNTVSYIVVDGEPVFGTVDSLTAMLNGTVSEVEPEAEVVPTVTAVAVRSGYKVYTVSVRKQFPAWDEVNGYTLPGIQAKSKREACAIVRDRFVRGGHIAEGRMYVSAVESGDQPENNFDDY